MKIGIDARFFGATNQGLGRYCEKLIEHLLQNPDGNTYVFFVSSRARLLEIPAHVRIVRTSIPWYGWREQLIWPLKLYRYRFDLMHFTHFNVPLLYNRRFIVTIHDVILLHQDRSAKASTRNVVYFFVKRFLYHKVIAHAVHKAMRIITVSEFSKKDIASFFPDAVNKIIVIYLGFFTAIADHPTPDALREKILLYVGSAYPHKNLFFLIRAFALWRKHHAEYSLHLVGTRDVFYNRISEYVTKNAIEGISLLGSLSDTELTSLYDRAYVYVFPSLYEGFGMPAIEALSRGLPVLASSATCLPEILGSAALYFSPTNQEDFLLKLTELCSNANSRKQIIDSGFARILKYDWEQMGHAVQNIYFESKN